MADYRDIEILPDSMVYCDIPYRNKRGYGVDECFDHDAFYEWALCQDVPVYVSEYTMPDDFVCISELNRVSTFSATNNAKREIERVFVQRRFADKCPVNAAQKGLFGEI